MKKKFILFLIFLTIVLGAIGFWNFQKNSYSKEILRLEIIGPTEAELGEEIEYIIKYKNNGDVRLENPKLVFEYPHYSILGSEESLRLEIGEEKLGSAIYPAEENTVRFKCRLLGKEGEAKEAKVSLSYQPKNLNAWYESKTSLITIIKKVPLSFNFDLPSKIEPGRDLKFSLNYFSNVSFPLSNLRIKIEYPSGFKFEKSKPEALGEKEWEIGILNKADGGRIEVSGIMSGELREDKIFKAELGTWRNGEFVLLKEINKGVEIVKPDIYISQYINGSPECVVSPGDLLHYEIFFKNLGEEPINNNFLVVQLEGKVFDLDSIRASTGNSESGDGSILFDWRKNSQLQFLDAQEEGRIDFWVELKENWEFSDLRRDRNPVARNKVILSETRGEFEAKINSRLQIAQRVYFQDEVFENSGPIPPRVGESTTYTVMWQARNYYNQVKNVKVKAVLPPEVSLTGDISPEEASESFSFDSQSREIVWNVRDLDVGAGVLSSPPNITFQISLRPIPSHIGTSTSLIGEARISGDDRWTNQALEGVASSIDTTLPDDETISEEMGIVQ